MNSSNNGNGTNSYTTGISEHEENIQAAVRLWALALEKKAFADSLVTCDHVAVEYIGFVERYHYCLRCDAKQIDGVWRDNPRRAAERGAAAGSSSDPR